MALIIIGPLLAAGCGASSVTMSVAKPPTTKETMTESSPVAPTSDVSQSPANDSASLIPSAEMEISRKSDSLTESHEEAAASPVKVDPMRLIGCWRDSFYGQRTLTICPDGKATMLCELDFAARLLYGKQVEFDLSWTLADTKLVFAITSGRPMETARSAIQKWGEKLEYTIQEADSGHLRVICNDGETVYTFRRLASDPDHMDEIN